MLKLSDSSDDSGRLDSSKGYLPCKRWVLYLWQINTELSTLPRMGVYEFDAIQVDAYDACFLTKDKKHQYSQDLFAMLVRAVAE